MSRPPQLSRCPLPVAGRSAFTLTEMMVSVSIMALVMTALITSHLFGLRMHELSKVKLGLNDESRAALSLLTAEIRAAKSVRLGTGTLSSFVEVPINTVEQANALQVYPTTDTNNFIRYFWDVTDNTLKRTTNGSSATTIVDSISNSLVFTAENYAGTILTNNQNNCVIGLNLQIYQLDYPVTQIGPGKFYDTYRLRTKVTRRALE